MSKRTLLLADDSVTIQKVVNLTFADEGIDVITVGDGDAAMEKISEAIPDIVLADVHMPGLSGYRICEIVRENPATKHLPVILLVGSFEPFDESEAARVGASAYLTKPFQSIRQLVSQVSALMEASTANDREPDVQEQAPPSEPAETNDIDSLYQQSFSEREVTNLLEPESAHISFASSEAEQSEPELELATGTSRYVDSGMDDEMIETSYGGDKPGVLSQLDPDLTEISHPMDGPSRAFESYADGGREESAAASVGGMDTVRNFDRFAETELIPDIGHSPDTSEFTLDDIELLDLPPMESGRTLEITASDIGDILGGGKQVVNLSPELMDIIVQKVVEKLSDKN